jgi:hypothetical protein
VSPEKLSREKVSLFKNNKIVARKIVAYGKLSPPNCRGFTTLDPPKNRRFGVRFGVR